MGESQIGLIQPERFAIYVASISSPMTVWAEGDQVVVVVCSARLPGNDVMYVDFDVATGRNGAAVAGLHEDAALQIGWYWRTVIAHGVRGGLTDRA
jgi:hypothetical protein